MHTVKTDQLKNNRTSKETDIQKVVEQELLALVLSQKHQAKIIHTPKGYSPLLVEQKNKKICIEEGKKSRPIHVVLSFKD